MLILTLIFVLLYGTALIGWLKPLADEKMVLRLEPLIFVLIGYYFGRLPAQQHEQSLKEEIGRQTQRADAAQHAKEQALQTREGLEEKLKNVVAALTSAVPAISMVSFTDDIHKSGGPIKEDGLRYTVAAAVRILNT